MWSDGAGGVSEIHRGGGFEPFGAGPEKKAKGASLTLRETPAPFVQPS